MKSQSAKPITYPTNGPYSLTKNLSAVKVTGARITTPTSQKRNSVLGMQCSCPKIGIARDVTGCTDYRCNARHIYALPAHNRRAPLRSWEALARRGREDGV